MAGGGEGRGREPFVPVSWDQALDLVAGELGACAAITARGDHGRFAGLGVGREFSTRRAGNCSVSAVVGGFVDSVPNHRSACARFPPMILGSAKGVRTGPLTSWSSIARHAKLMVLFGGAIRRTRR